jgi:aminomethyltransferase
MSETRRTPLSTWHEQQGARMVDFAGYLMPVQYESVLVEHRRVRNGVGLFDISHMAEFHLRGSESRAAVDSLITNNLATLSVGRVLYTALCKEDGGVLDDLLVYCLAEDHFLVVANAANHEKVAAWLKARLPATVEFADESDSTALIAIQGPSSLDLLLRWSRAAAFKEELRTLQYYHTLQPEIAGQECILSRTGYTGEKGYELYLPSEMAVSAWEELLAAGKELSVGPVGLGARDTLRLEACYSLYGHELDEEHSPLESNIGWVVRLKTPVDFPGKKVFKAQKKEGVSNCIAGFKVEGKAIARQGALIFADGKEVGKVTSGTFSPTLERGIALARVQETALQGKLEVEIRNKRHPLLKTEIPFVPLHVKD